MLTLLLPILEREHFQRMRTQPSTEGSRECECDIRELECNYIKMGSLVVVCLFESKGTEK